MAKYDFFFSLFSGECWLLGSVMESGSKMVVFPPTFGELFREYDAGLELVICLT